MIVGYSVLDDRNAPTGGGDADDVWFYYHAICPGEKEADDGCFRSIEKHISSEEAMAEEYVCDWCGTLLFEEVNYAE